MLTLAAARAADVPVLGRPVMPGSGRAVVLLDDRVVVLKQGHPPEIHAGG